ncbi:uncharacterized protein TEOVI_000257900 [Trypanosoma equiperdum]|uniref:Uncharacterized protein n=1 Tax=Trypanosoma equiperdum TaxID=5694 RepID=A0A1G4IF37_TRYEQ|nr:hypothetical protein, conserved [Trypanosoma equiperdum]
MSSQAEAQKQRRCRLILVCSDGDAADIRYIGFILSKAACHFTPPRDSSDADSVATRSSRVVLDEQETDDFDQNGVVAEVQAAFMKYMSAKRGTNVPATAIGAAPAKGGKPKGGKAAGASGAKGATALSSPTEGSQKTQAGDGNSWYSVVHNRRCTRPLVIVHHIPSFDRPEEDAVLAAALPRNPNPADAVATIQKALCTIVDEMEGRTAPVSRRVSRARSVSLRGDASEGLKEAPRVATPVPLTRMEAHAKEMSILPVVVPIRDPRVLAFLLGHGCDAPPKRLDIRLVVNFVDAPTSPGGTAQVAGVSCTPSSQRQRTTPSSKRQPGRDAAAGQTASGSKEGDVNTVAPSGSSFAGVIEQCARLGLATTITDTDAALHAYTALCMREIVENRGDDKSSVIRRCLDSVLPTVFNVVSNMTYYTRCMSTKATYQCPNLPLPLPQEEAATFPPPSGGSVERGRPHFCEDAPRSVCPGCEPSFPFRDWSHYLQGRKVCDQWTCVSALHALAAQVTVSLARRQTPKYVRPVPREELTPVHEVHSTPHSETVSTGKELSGTHSLLPQSIYCYAEKEPILSAAFPRHEGIDDEPLNEQIEAAVDAATKRHASESKLKDRKSPGRLRKQTQSPSPIPHSPSELASTQHEGNDPAVMLPLDHTMDRPFPQPTQNDVRCLTREFVQKGLGVFKQDNPITMTLSLPNGGRSYSSMRAQELLEEPMNGLVLNMAEEGVDLRLLERVEKLFSCTDRTSGVTFDKIREAAEAAALRAPFVDEKLQRSVERSLTPRERTHVLQCFFLEMIAAAIGVSDKVVNADFPEGRQSNSVSITALTPSLHEGFYPNARPLEENISKRAAIRCLNDFSSRFGEHLCRLVRCVVPDPLESIYGNLAMFRSVGAENTRVRDKVVAVMAGGVVTPIQRQSIRVWCHYISGVPSLDQFNELLSSESVCLGTTLTLPTLSSAPTDIAKTFGATQCFGGDLGDAIRVQLLRDLRNSPQFIIPQLEEVVRGRGVWRSEGDIQTALEGRHTLYPHDNSIIEVITTDRSRICRYVRASEIICTLHYYIAPPPRAAPSSSPAVTNATSTSAQTAGEAVDGGFSACSSAPPSSRRKEEELMYFTAAFDDGVVLTCSARPRYRLQYANSTINSDKDGAYGSGFTPRDALNGRGRLQSRKSIGPFSGRVRGGLPGSAQGPTQALKRRLSRRPRSRSRGEDDGSNSGKNAQEGMTRTFPVDDSGSILLWPAVKDPKHPHETAVQLPVQHGVPAVAITVSAGGVSVHNEEHEGILWLSRHDSMRHPVPELVRCAHCVGEEVVLQRSMEVEVRRALIEDSGIVCRYFHSGTTQMLYPDGMIVTGYPVAPVGGVSSTQEDGAQPVVETVLTPEGLCYVREVGLEETGSLHPVPSGNVESCMTYDRCNHCHTMSRADGLIVVTYNKYFPHKTKKEGNAASLGAGKTDQKHGCGGGFDEMVLARVALHVDGTCITSLLGGLLHGADEHLPVPLAPLLEDAAAVQSSCDADVQYCVEGPFFPRVFLCAPLYKPVDNQASRASRAEVSFGVGDNPKVSSQLNDKDVSHDGNNNRGLLSPLSQGAEENANSSYVASFARDPAPTNDPKPYDRFYVLFGDGTVLRRRVIYRGMRGTVTPFLETLFTRRSETSVRILHESGVVIVEPAEAGLRNRSSVMSMAVGEGFPVFDVALGGLRLVDGRQHLTEVKHLYSSGPVQSSIRGYTLEHLLRQLVLPMYTPHKVTKARWQAMRREEIEAEEEDRRNRISGKCPPLTNRLREIAEEFVIANNLLSMSLLKSAAQESKRCSEPPSASDAKLPGSATPIWGQRTQHDNLLKNAANVQPRERPQLVDVFDAQSYFPQDSSPPTVIAPLFFSEMQDGRVVQYLQLRDVNDFIRERASGVTPVFLSLSTCTGEPGVQQMTFLRLAENKEMIDADEPSVNKMSLHRSPYNWGTSHAVTASSLAAECGLTDARTGAAGNVMMLGSKLGEAVNQQRNLALFSGGTSLFPTSRWLPVVLQPPRRFLKHCRHSMKDTGKVNFKADSAFSGDRIGGGANVIDAPAGPHNLTVGDSPIEQLRMFFKFSDVAGVVQQLLLLEVSRRQRQLASLVQYSKAAGTTCGFGGTPVDDPLCEGSERPTADETASFNGTAPVE